MISALLDVELIDLAEMMISPVVGGKLGLALSLALSDLLGLALSLALADLEGLAL